MAESCELTEQSQKMLAAIHVAQRLASVLTMARLNLLMNLVELRPLKAVEQNTP